MSADQFRAAVEWTKGFIESSRIRNGWDLASDAGWQSYLSEKAGKLTEFSAILGFSPPGGNFLAGPLGDYSEEKAQDAWNERVADLVEHASSDHLAYQAVVLGIASVLETGGKLHPDLRAFLVLHLRGKVGPPPPPRGRKSSGGVHVLASQAVRELVDAGWKPLKSEGSNSACACEVVAVALAELKLSPITYSGVKKVWLELPAYMRRGPANTRNDAP